MERFFVYGSLRSGMYNYDNYLKNRIVKTTKAYVKGKLHAIHGVSYPALIHGENWIVGEIMESEDSAIWNELDELEGYYGEGNIENEYHKVYMDIYDEDHRCIDHLPVYFFNIEKPSHVGILAEEITSGDYVAYMQIKK